MIRRRALWLTRLAVLAGSLGFAASAHAKVPVTLTHQGRLYSSAAGNAPVSGKIAVVFTVYDAATAGAALWTETLQVTFDDGYFSEELGAMTPFPATVFDGSTRYLGIQVGTDGEMTPRATIGSVPYAFLANDVNGDIHPTTVSVGGTTVIDANGNWVGGSMGVTGATGPEGPEGPEGLPGATGAQGPVGPTGLAGPQGLPGATGAQGPAGAVGSQGPAGVIGPQGLQGVPGAAGAQGPAGPVGPAGAVGAQGSIGPAGPAGVQGAQGPIGAAGPAGAQGPIGAAGPAGAQGPSGAAGPAGAQGPIGPAGPAGAQGPIGPAGPVNVPSCSGTQVLSGVGGVLTCVTRPGLGIYVGNSAVSTNGSISHTGQPTGLLSAAAYCGDSFGAGAHMCTVQEIYNSVVAGVLQVGVPTAPAWLYFPAWNEPAGTPTAGNNPGQGVADNCGSYTYPTADRLWRGIAFEWNANATGNYSPLYDGTPCFTPLPIACCE